MGKKLFGGVKGAKGPSDGNYFKDGTYIVRIDRVKIFDNRKDQTKVAVEATVLSVVEEGTQGGHRVGDQVSQIMDPKWDLFLGIFKSFVECAMRCDFADMEDDEAEAACDMVCGEDQPLSGVICRVVNRIVTTKQDTNFTKVTWTDEIAPGEAIELMSPKALAVCYPGEKATILQAEAEARAQQDAASAE
jgi:hypothetical protein